MLILKGNSRMMLHFNRGKEAGEKGYTDRCPYVAGSEREFVWAWEQGHKQALEAAA